MKLMKIFAFTIAGALLAGGAFANKDRHALRAAPHTSITFENSSAQLTDEDKGELRALMKDAQEQGYTAEEVIVAAWSDKSLPKRGQKLNDADRDLAKRRANVISDFLRTDLEVADVDTYNMAETANWLARTFNTRDAELKSIFGKTAAEIPVNKPNFHAIREEGGPNMAVVMVRKLKTDNIYPSDQTMH